MEHGDGDDGAADDDDYDAPGAAGGGKDGAQKVKVDYGDDPYGYGLAHEDEASSFNGGGGIGNSKGSDGKAAAGAGTAAGAGAGARAAAHAGGKAAPRDPYEDEDEDDGDDDYSAQEAAMMRRREELGGGVATVQQLQQQPYVPPVTTEVALPQEVLPGADEAEAAVAALAAQVERLADPAGDPLPGVVVEEMTDEHLPGGGPDDGCVLRLPPSLVFYLSLPIFCVDVGAEFGVGAGARGSRCGCWCLGRAASPTLRYPVSHTLHDGTRSQSNLLLSALALEPIVTGCATPTPGAPRSWWVTILTTLRTRACPG